MNTVISRASLTCDALTVGYGALAAVRDITLEVRPGEVVALIGPNGAGKTTLLLGIAGVLKPSRGKVYWYGTPLDGPLHRRARAGLGFIGQEKSVIMSLTARENLKLGKSDVEEVCDWFPELIPLLDRRAGLLSGGEQQMLTLGRALSRRPQVLLVDELSLGLAPLIADRLGVVIRERSNEGLAVLLVEQNVARALAVSDRFYILKQGEFGLAGSSAEYRDRLDVVQRHYLPNTIDD
jgi:branched-chain amino acid transport system ATP-binding protein